MNLDDLMKESSVNPLDGILTDNPSESRVQDLETILGVVRTINTTLELKKVLELVIDEAIRIARAERGFLMLAGDDGKLHYAVGRDANGQTIDEETLRVSSSVLDDVYRTGESICIENALSDERFERRQSIMNLELQTIICSSLQTREEKIGVIYVDSKFIQAVDKSNIVNLFEILAGQAAIAIKNARLYANLRRAYEDLQQANQHIIQSERMAMKGELAAEVSHELKNLVAVVLLNLDLMRRKAENVTPEEISAITEKTIAGARKIEGFSRSLLSRSRVGANRIPSSVNKTVSDFVDFIKFLPKFKTNTVTAALAEGLPPVDLDIDQIQQVLLNLVNNSVEASRSVALELKTELDEKGHCVRLLVKDNGPGIDESILDKLFAEKVTTKVDGHGYGLPICRQILEAHGGTIVAQSTKGVGVTFTMTFPISSTHPCH